MTKVKKPAVRVRIAPSPTGNLHIGTARTALFNWLFAKHHSDTFILRIEDTDHERSELKYEQDIIAGLEWLGLKWDECYKQSERSKVYRKYLDKLAQAGKVERRELTAAEKKAAAADGKKASDVLFVVECNPVAGPAISFHDLIKGDITVERKFVSDQIIARLPDKNRPDEITFLYNFTVVVDDISNAISHVIRGEDHLSNTPKQLLIYQALGVAPPQFAHLPLILGEDKAKLSKRHGATALNEYRALGYLPDALVNFMALLGWTVSDGGKELFTKNELIEQFADLSKIHQSGAVFDIKKLNWLNAQYIKMENDAGLAKLVMPFVQKYFGAQPEERVIQMAGLLRERLEYLDQVKEFHYFFKAPGYDTDLLLWKKSDRAGAQTALTMIGQAKITNENLDKIATAHFAGERGAVYWPLRVALSGEKFSADPVQIARILTGDEVSARIDTALEKLK